jgi:hypothetical protein
LHSLSPSGYFTKTGMSPGQTPPGLIP